jgi:hypothetical protein
MKTLREMIDIVEGKVNENWGSWIEPKVIVPPIHPGPIDPTYYNPVLNAASVEELEKIIADPSTKKTTREMAKKIRARKLVSSRD